jgi:SAM-dependent methyltransferase
MLDWNHRQWAAAGVSVNYTRDQRLYAPETVVLEGLGAGFSNKRILDIGVGGGRTTPHLLKISPDYIGIDYAEPMVRECQRLYPRVKFEVADARDLSSYKHDPFDFVMFSFNGIDNLEHADRLKCLAEIRSVIRSNGAFVFSTHNRNRESIPRPWSLEHFDLKRNPTLNPLKLARRSLNYATGQLNHMRLSQRQKFNDEYAIINDNGDQYRFLSYHISPDQQIAQLARVGFDVELMIDTQGRILERDTHSTISDSWMVYYVCRPRRAAH